MLKVSPYNINTSASVSFGTTERKSDLRLHKNGETIANCDYFIRPAETLPDEMGRFLLSEAQNAKEVERKIWGCSDLSMFVSRKLAMINSVGVEKYREAFGNVELIDIDKDIINRAQKGLIGATTFDFKLFEDSLGFKLQDNLTPVQDKTNFFLDGEPTRLGAFWMPDSRIKPYKLSDIVMDGLNIHTGDIREDLKNLPKSSEGVKRIFEFANGWYFMKSPEQVNLVSLLSEKMRIDDIMIVGSCELREGVGELFNRFGFEQVSRVPEAFRKVQDLHPFDFKLTKSLMKALYKVW